MTVSISNASVREVLAGILVSKAANVSPLVTGSTVNLFTITGGRILLVALIGEVTTIIQAQATVVQFISTPSAGSVINLSGNTTDITGLEVGGRITLGNPPAAGTQVVKTNAGYTNLQNAWTVVPAGTIGVTYGAASTGAVKYDLLYVPLDSAALVAAA
jgi:hypothetical protein